MARQEEDLARLIAFGGPEATEDGLRSVRGRRHRAVQAKRRRIVGGSAIGVLALVATTVAVSTRGPSRELATPREPSANSAKAEPTNGGALFWRTPVPEESRAAPAGLNAACATADGCSSATPLFSRSHDGVRVVATLVSGLSATPAPGPRREAPGYTGIGGTSTSACPAANELAVAISEDGGAPISHLVVQTVLAPASAIETIDTTSAMTSGGQRITVVALRTGSAVTTTEAQFADGHQDAMATRSGWSVLIDSELIDSGLIDSGLVNSAANAAATTSVGKVLLFGTKGQLLVSQPIERVPGIALPVACHGSKGPPTPTPTHRSSG